MPDTLDRLVTAEEAATFCGLKVATIRKLTYQRAIPCVRPTGRRAVRYRLSDLQKLMALRTQGVRG